MKIIKDLKCPFCGINTPENNGTKYISKEHVPPKCLFIYESSDLITVPCCHSCNNGSSSADIEFKINLGLYLGYRSPDFWQETLNSLNKSSIRKKRKAQLLKQFSPILTRDKKGNWVHNIKMETKFVKSTVHKIIRGLYWHVTNDIMPENANIRVILIRQDEAVPYEVQKILCDTGRNLSSGRNAFGVTYSFAEDHEFASIWKLSFYGICAFCVIVDSE